jgi:O-antigen ligase
VGTSLLIGAVAVSRDWQKLKSALWLGLPGIMLLVPLVWNYSGYVGARLNFEDSFEKNPYENRSIGQRLELNDFGVKIFLDRPLTGIGPGASALAIKKYYSAIFVPPHFVLLVVAMETGFVGLCCYLLLLFLPFLVVLRKKVNLISNPLLLTAFALLISMTLIGFFDIYPWLLPPGRLWQWLSWGLWAVAYEMDV